eukprot:TRINITY_DN10284_c0_g1_i1.p1 TRINITY_DN10284_c0_g1~~TRINITY_DN10284_c0_g1_i1.p1  ORF type:complete len:268 (+),score=65.13 TRINITY_DN10284_c0_g1_i1:94-897(+)
MRRIARALSAVVVLFLAPESSQAAGQEDSSDSLEGVAAATTAGALGERSDHLRATNAADAASAVAGQWGEEAGSSWQAGFRRLQGLGAPVEPLPPTAEAGAVPGCQRPFAFGRWILEYERVCTLQTAKNMSDLDKPGIPVLFRPLQDDCAWITCPCMEVALQVPVQLDSITSCWETANNMGSFSEVQRQLAMEMMRGTACGFRTRRMAQPCGECDRYHFEREQCRVGTLPPKYFVVPPAASQAEGRRPATSTLLFAAGASLVSAALL